MRDTAGDFDLTIARADAEHWSGSTTTTPTTGNEATLAQTIPANASLAGLQFFAQAGALNAGGPAVLGGALGNALACTVGVR